VRLRAGYYPIEWSFNVKAWSSLRPYSQIVVYPEKNVSSTNANYSVLPSEKPKSARMFVHGARGAFLT